MPLRALVSSCRNLKYLKVQGLSWFGLLPAVVSGAGTSSAWLRVSCNCESASPQAGLRSTYHGVMQPGLNCRYQCLYSRAPPPHARVQPVITF